MGYTFSYKKKHLHKALVDIVLVDVPLNHQIGFAYFTIALTVKSGNMNNPAISNHISN